MTELILLAVIIVLCVLIGVKEYFATKERNKFINAITSKNAGEQAMLDMGDKVKPEPSKPPDLIPLDNLTDEEYKKYIETGGL